MLQHTHSPILKTKALPHALRWGFVVLCLSFAGVLVAQPQPPDTVWTRFYNWPGRQAVYGSALGEDGGLVLAGWSSEAGAMRIDASVFRMGANGDTVWTRAYGDSLDSGFAALKRIGNEGFVAVGTAHEAETRHSQFYIVRLDADGAPQWTRRLVDSAGEDVASDVELTPDGGFIVGGYSSRASEPVAQAYVVRLTSAGDTLWTHFYRQPGPNPAMTAISDIEPAGDGGFILAGFVRYYTLERAYVIRIDADGDTLWTRALDSPSFVVQRIRRTLHGGYIVAGNVSAQVGSNAALLKLNTQGVLDWVQTYSPNGFGEGNLADVVHAEGGGYVAAGMIRTTADPPRDYFYVVRTTDMGDTLWTAAIRTVQFGSATTLVQTHDNGFLAAGMAAGFDPDASSLFVIRLASDPNNVRPEVIADHVFVLAQNFPNPFNPTTTVSFSLATAELMRLQVFDLTGRLIQTLADRRFESGEHSLLFDGAGLPSGIYFARLQAGQLNRTQKMILLK